MSGWVKGITQRAWEIAAETMAKPWDEECALADLAYWDDEYTPKRPSLRGLAERWGWTLWQVRQLVDGAAQAPHNSRTISAQLPHTSKRSNAENKTQTAQLPHNLRTTPAQAPHAYLYTDIQTTDIQTTDNNSPLPLSKILPDRVQPPVTQTGQDYTILSEEPGFLDTPLRDFLPDDSEKNGLPPRTTEGRTEPGAELTPLASASRSNLSEMHDKAFLDAAGYQDMETIEKSHIAQMASLETRPEAPPPTQFRRQLQGAEGLNPTQSKENSAFEVDDYALFVKHWLTRKPGAVPHVSSKPAQFVKDCIRRRGLEACISVIDWVHDSGHPRATFLHEHSSVSYNALFKQETEADYINLANQWVASGRKSQALKLERNPFDTESGWEGSRDIDFSQFEPLDDKIGEAFEKML